MPTTNKHDSLSETDTGIPRSSPVSGDGDHVPYERNAVISRHFERDPIPYALETELGRLGRDQPHSLYVNSKG
jgi:hypothetical protein